VYTNGDVTKTIYADGKIEQNGTTITNYFGNQTSITSPPTAAQAGFSEDTLVNAKYEGNKLVSVQYTPPTTDPNADTNPTYTLDVRTGKLVNDVTGEVQGTVSTKIDNFANQAQYNYLQQQKSSIDAEAEARAGTDNPMSAGEYLQRTQVIRSQESALTNGYIPNEAGQSVQVASLNVGTAKDFADTSSVVTSNQTNLEVNQTTTPLSTLPLIAGASNIVPEGFNTRTSGQPAQTITDAVPTNTTNAAATAATKLEPIFDPANGAFMGYQEVPATVNPAAASNTNKPAIVVDDVQLQAAVQPNTLGPNIGTSTYNYGNPIAPGMNVYSDTGAIVGTYNNQLQPMYVPSIANGIQLSGPIVDSRTGTIVEYVPSTQLDANGKPVGYDRVDTGIRPANPAADPNFDDPANSGKTPAPTTSDSNGTKTSGDAESQGGANDASSAGNPVASAAGAGMGGGGC
jgi:hypothetical protein